MRSVKSVEFVAPSAGRYAEILTPEAVAFVVGLQRTFNERRKELLAARVARQKRLDAGEQPDFLKETKAFARVSGRWRRCLRICWTGAWRLRGRWTAR